ncbi:glycosyltransferase family 39 protein [Mycotypha africana]|uniref:glycosyltransferase family 39 protein n=1 Tax=Mycotypha africana TaxID=64632 RepID=UPI002301B1C9|nr:glycosyltransferase family 39 protein [Mycotypha africana]KAI8973653.1 glycosyltransferase family 39 protein [Mycotypha africana]
MTMSTSSSIAHSEQLKQRRSNNNDADINTDVMLADKLLNQECNHSGENKVKHVYSSGFVQHLPSQQRSSVFSNWDWILSTALTLWACYIRLWKLYQPSSVVFDEVHFGGFASKYINKKFFMDVHPPLAKILITWAAQVAGFDGQFDFKKIGKDYIEPRVPYTPIRAFCALNGVMLVPFAYWTMRGCGYSMPTAILTAAMILYENGFITNNRLILLDSILLFFTAFTILAWINFRRYTHRPFTLKWWKWMVLTGIGLGCTVSSKWVGLFTIAMIGVSVIHDLWVIWGDKRNTVARCAQHFLARAICLIIIPCSIYLSLFKLHFDMLPLTGTGTSFMSPEFQSTLSGYKFPESTKADVIYGSKISIRHMGTRGSYYLHSHDHRYPGGSKQQQVTLYSHVDANNWWYIYKGDTEEVNEVEYIKHGDIVRLKHASTKRRLHTHDIRPITNDEKYINEVSAYGFENFDGDDNDLWRVEIEDYDGSDPYANERLRARRSKFKLVSVSQDCELFSRRYKLPEWGYKQQEVVCHKKALKAKTLWMIETVKTDMLPEEADVVTYEKPGFLRKFLELQKVMWDVNKGLPSAHAYGSRPKDWPLLKRGISFWSNRPLKIYLLGNPIVFWSTTACIITYILFKSVVTILAKRQMLPSSVEHRFSRYEGMAAFFFAGWALHYFPFNLMDRQLFLHHYMPALYIATLMFGVIFEAITSRFNSPLRWFIVVLAITTLVYVYRIFIPITYGEPWSEGKCLQATWRPTWDFHCTW